MNKQREHREHLSPEIAVVGVSALFPGSTDARGFWQDIVEGDDQIREVPPQHWLLEDYYDPDPAAPDKTYGNTGAFLDEIAFDSMAFGIPPTIIQQTDTSQLLALIVAQKVLDDAAESSFGHVDKSRISVILGATGTTELVVHLGSRLQKPLWLKALRENGVPEDEAQEICQRIADNYVPWTEASFPGLLGQRGCRAHRQQARSRRHKLCRRRRLRQFTLRPLHGSERTLPQAVGHGHRRRR